MVTVCAVTCGGMVSVSVGAYGCGHCFCRGVGVWSVYLQAHMGVVTVSTRTCGCGHCFYRHIWVWSQIEQGHGDLVSVSVRAYRVGHRFSRAVWAWSLFLQVGVVTVSLRACGHVVAVLAGTSACG